MRMAKSAVFWIFAFAIAALLSVQTVHAVSGPYNYQGKQYYVVNSADPTEDTGAKVCAKVGLNCIGYTAFNTNVCKAFHPDATVTSGVDGSKAGFYCNGSPQQGRCGTETNTCDICPACNVNADCSFEIKYLFREMYIECANQTASIPPIINPVQPSFFSNFLSLIKSFFSGIFSKLSGFFVQNVAVKTVQIGPYPDKWGCEFFQIPWPGVNKKLVTCNAIGAADNFCALVLTSPYAKAEVCDNNGLIVCSNPCKAPVQQVMPASCPFDNDRPRGNQAPPISWCTPKSQPPSPAAGAKLCPIACWLYDAGAGMAGIANINCEVAPANIHQQLATCAGTETQIGQGIKSCSCQPVETVSEPCPNSCGTSQATCLGNVNVIGKSGVPCDGTVQGINSNCKCILRNGQWVLGSQYNVR